MKGSISDFYCTCCGSKTIPLYRKEGRYREAGHLKKLYCYKCKREVNCVEVRPFGDYRYNDFILEYTYGNFDDEGNRKIPYKEFIGTLKQNGEYIYDLGGQNG